MRKILVIMISLVFTQVTGEIRQIGHLKGSVREYMHDVQTFEARLSEDYLSRFPSDSIYALDIPINQEYLTINDTLLIIRDSRDLVKSIECFNTLKELRQKFGGFDVECYYDDVPHITLLYNSRNYLAYFGSDEFNGFYLGAAITIDDEFDFGGIKVGDSIEDLAVRLGLNQSIPNDATEIILAGNLVRNKWNDNRTSIQKGDSGYFDMRFTIREKQIVRICYYGDCFRDYPMEVPLIHIPALDGKEMPFPETILYNGVELILE